MRVNLAAELGLAVAERFLAAHRALTGADHHPWWDVASAVDVASEAPAAWRGAEDLVAAALACLAGEPGPGGGLGAGPGRGEEHHHPAGGQGGMNSFLRPNRSVR
jgi:hypothetical protein